MAADGPGHDHGDSASAGRRALLGDRFGVDHATLQVESGDLHETVALDCYPVAGEEAPGEE